MQLYIATASDRCIYRWVWSVTLYSCISILLFAFTCLYLSIAKFYGQDVCVTTNASSRQRLWAFDARPRQCFRETWFAIQYFMFIWVCMHGSNDVVILLCLRHVVERSMAMARKGRTFSRSWRSSYSSSAQSTRSLHYSVRHASVQHCYLSVYCWTRGRWNCLGLSLQCKQCL